MVFQNENIYKVLKRIWQYGLPALMFFWEGFIQIWNIPYGTAILGTLGLAWGALAIFLGISKSKYNNALQGYLSDGGGEDDEIGVG